MEFIRHILLQVIVLLIRFFFGLTKLYIHTIEFTFNLFAIIKLLR